MPPQWKPTFPKDPGMTLLIWPCLMSPEVIPMNLQPRLKKSTSTFAEAAFCPCFLLPLPQHWCKTAEYLIFFIICFFNTSLSLVVNLGHLTCISHSSHKSSTNHSYHYPFLSECVVFSWCPNNGMAVSVWDFSCVHRYWCMWLHRQEVDFGRKIPCHTGDSNLRQYYTRLFSQTLYQLSYPHPFTLWALNFMFVSCLWVLISGVIHF